MLRTPRERCSIVRWQGSSRWLRCCPFRRVQAQRPVQCYDRDGGGSSGGDTTSTCTGCAGPHRRPRARCLPFPSEDRAGIPTQPPRRCQELGALPVLAALSVRVDFFSFARANVQLCRSPSTLTAVRCPLLLRIRAQPGSICSLLVRLCRSAVRSWPQTLISIGTAVAQACPDLPTRRAS